MVMPFNSPQNMGMYSAPIGSVVINPMGGASMVGIGPPPGTLAWAQNPANDTTLRSFNRDLQEKSRAWTMAPCDQGRENFLKIQSLELGYQPPKTVRHDPVEPVVFKTYEPILPKPEPLPSVFDLIKKQQKEIDNAMNLFSRKY